MVAKVKRFKFDLESFRTFFMIHAKYTRKNFDYHSAMAKLVMTAAFRQGLTPRYILNKDCTKSGVDELYVQFAKDVDTAGQKIVNISEYRKS